MKNQLPNRLLVLAYGNPGRGDDGLGPQLLTLLQGCAQDFKAVPIDFILDFQLQIEHVLDLQTHHLVLFMDAQYPSAMSSGVGFKRVVAAKDDSTSTHHLSPAALLTVYQQALHHPAPPAFLLTIPGQAFELGQALSQPARCHLVRAFALGYYLLQMPDLAVWQACRC